MYSVEMSPSGGASAVAIELPVPGTMRELSVEELLLVSGAWSWHDFGGSVFAGALGGAATGLYLGGLHGAGLGAIGGAIGGGFTYIGSQVWNWLAC